MKVQGWTIKLGSFLMTSGMLFSLEYFVMDVHDKFIYFVLAFLLCLFFGEYIIFTKRNPDSTLINIAWGLVYGALTVLILSVAMIVYVSYLDSR